MLTLIISRCYLPSYLIIILPWYDVFMKIMSPNFDDKSTIPVDFTADGENICPDFNISEVPDGAKSLAVVCHDPDATAGIPWVHWVVWKLPNNTDKIQKGNLPPGSVEGITSFGTRGYGGPSPSPGSGPHRYVFTSYALSKDVNLLDDKQMSYADILTILQPAVIDTAEWTGVYQRA